MRCPRLRRLRRPAIALLLAPPMLWALALAAMPTAWLRDRLVDTLRRETGRPAAVARVRLRPLGGLRIEGLRLGAPEAPWLRVEALSMDLDLARLLAGRVEPSWLEARGLDLRLRRRADGTIELGDLLARPEGDETSSGTAGEAAPCPGPTLLAFRLADSRVRVIDEPGGTAVDLADLRGVGTWRRSRVTFERLEAASGGGRVELAGHVDRSGGWPTFEGQLRAEGVAPGGRAGALRFLAPLLEGVDSTGASLDLDVYLRGGGPDPSASLVGRGVIGLGPLDLGDSPAVATLGRLLGMPPKAGRGSIRGHFQVQSGRVHSDDLTIRAGRLPVTLAGSADFAGRLDYRVRTDAVLAPRAAGGRPLPVDLDDLVELRLVGTVAHPVLTADGVPLDGDAGRREQLIRIGRRARDRVFR